MTLVGESPPTQLRSVDYVSFIKNTIDEPHYQISFISVITR
jgi:hypothetical protein